MPIPLINIITPLNAEPPPSLYQYLHTATCLSEEGSDIQTQFVENTKSLYRHPLPNRRTTYSTS